jgi:hypothetical protein
MNPDVVITPRRDPPVDCIDHVLRFDFTVRVMRAQGGEIETAGYLIPDHELLVALLATKRRRKGSDGWRALWRSAPVCFLLERESKPEQIGLVVGRNNHLYADGNTFRREPCG